MNLVLDIGNSRTKAAVFNATKLVQKQVFENSDASRSVGILTMCAGGVERVIVSSTRRRDDDNEMIAILKERCGNVLWFDNSVPVPLKNSYATPQTLGCDRIAAAVGGQTLFREKNLLIFDFGTAITADVVTAQGEFLGGSISPGLWMRLKAMHDYTGRLPMIDSEQCVQYEQKSIPASTVEAMMSGAMEGIIFEVRGRIEAYSAMFPLLVTIFTGGEASGFEKRFKNTIFAEDDLVLAGLNTILDYNANKKDNN